MKERIYIIIAALVFLAATGFAFQDQDDTSKVKKEVPAIPKEEALKKELEAAKKELEILRKETDADKRKRDSIDAERAVTLDMTTTAVGDLRKSNKALRTVTARLAFIVSKINPDTAMKYYGEFDEIAPRDTIKKKIDREIVAPEIKRKNIFQKFWSIFKRKNS